MVTRFLIILQEKQIISKVNVSSTKMYAVEPLRSFARDWQKSVKRRLVSIFDINITERNFVLSIITLLHTLRYYHREYYIF